MVNFGTDETGSGMIEPSPPVAEEAVASGARGKFKVSGRVQALSGAAIASGELLDVSADLKCDPLAVQTDGNGSLKALDAAAGADELVWCKFL